MKRKNQRFTIENENGSEVYILIINLVLAVDRFMNEEIIINIKISKAIGSKF
jgi:hypothetical protein